jgi:FaeA-like protein
MIMKQQEQTYSKDDFFHAMPINTPITQSRVVKCVGCSESTARKYLRQLEKQGNVLKVPIRGSYNVYWKRIMKTRGELLVEREKLDGKPREGEVFLASCLEGDVSEQLFRIVPLPHAPSQWYRLRTCGCDAIISRKQAKKWLIIKDMIDNVEVYISGKSKKELINDCLDGR